jgi:hypothetical protein
MTTPNTVSTLRLKLGSTGGFTVRMEGTRPREFVTSGYALSIYPDREHIVPAMVGSVNLLGFLTRYADENSNLLSLPDHYFGAWLDRDAGKIYLDVTRVEPEYEEAMRLAKVNNQLAIFDLDSGTEILTGVER